MFFWWIYIQGLISEKGFWWQPTHTEWKARRPARAAVDLMSMAYTSEGFMSSLVSFNFSALAGAMGGDHEWVHYNDAATSSTSHTHTHSLCYETCACIWTYGNSEMIHPTNRPAPNNRRCHAKFETRSVCAIQPPHRHTHHNIHYNREIVLRMPDTNLHIDYGCFHTKPFSTSGDLWTLKNIHQKCSAYGSSWEWPLASYSREQCSLRVQTKYYRCFFGCCCSYSMPGLVNLRPRASMRTRICVCKRTFMKIYCHPPNWIRRKWYTKLLIYGVTISTNAGPVATQCDRIWSPTAMPFPIIFICW